MRWPSTPTSPTSTAGNRSSSSRGTTAASCTAPLRTIPRRSDASCAGARCWVKCRVDANARQTRATRNTAPLLEVIVASAEEPQQSDDDQIDGNNVVEQARHDQDEDAGDQGNERADAECEIHDGLPFSSEPKQTHSSPGTNVGGGAK